MNINLNTNIKNNLNIKAENLMKNVKLEHEDSIKKPLRSKKNKEHEQGDRLTISKQGRENSHIANLMNQRQFAMDKKQEINSVNKEKESSPEEIQQQLKMRLEEIKVIDEEIKNLDSQIAKAVSNQLEKEVEEKRNTKLEEPKSEEEVENEKLADMTKLATDIDQVEAIHGHMKNLEGKIGILESEIKLDKSHFASGSSKKEIELVKSEQKLEDLFNDLGEKSGEILENTNKYNKAQDEDEEETDIEGERKGRSTQE